MVCLARLILKDAPIVLLDEPTEGLDQSAIAHFNILLNAWSGKKTILIVTHKDI
jgi:ATP-binding cassette subfamily C protein CydC